MNLEVMKNTVTSKVALQMLKTKKVSPQLLFGAGIIGVVGTVVLACKATLDLDSVLSEAEIKHDKAEVTAKNSKQAKRDHVRINLETTLVLGQLYAPAVVVGCASIAALTGSHIIITKRNVALTAAYKAVDEAFNTYRDRVREDLGDEKEQQYRRGLVKTEVHDTKAGKVSKRTSPTALSEYARVFDETNKNFSPNIEYNIMFLRANQNYANHLLQTRGHVFLNDVYDAMGMERSSAGSVVGWVKGHGDDYIDFGVFTDDAKDEFYDFVVGIDAGLWLDFNVDGVIYDLI